MNIYQELMKAYREGLRVRIIFRDGAVEPDTWILRIYEEFDFVPSDDYVNFYGNRVPYDRRETLTCASSDFNSVRRVDFI